MKRLDLTGQRFGRLLVQAIEPVTSARIKWACLCDCGQRRVVSTTHLRSGHTQSCGCLTAEVTSQRNVERAKHGMWKTPEFRAWLQMNARCYRPTAQGYERYGGRGITVCDEWREDFKAFYDHIGPRPSGQHSVDRMRNAEGYKPGNVRWATDVEQNNNKRTNVTAVIGGVEMTAAQIAERFGLGYQMVNYRIRVGKSEAEIIAKSRRG